MSITVTRESFLKDKQGRTFADVLNDTNQPFDEVLEFFNLQSRQRRMEEAEIHHDRAPWRVSCGNSKRKIRSTLSCREFIPAGHNVCGRRLAFSCESLWRVVAGERPAARVRSAYVPRHLLIRQLTTRAGWPSGSSAPKGMNWWMECRFNRSFDGTGSSGQTARDRWRVSKGPRVRTELRLAGPRYSASKTSLTGATAMLDESDARRLWQELFGANQSPHSPSPRRNPCSTT